MGIEAAGSFYFDNTRLMPSGAGNVRDRASASGTGEAAFAGILEKAREKAASPGEPAGEEPPSPVSKKTVVDKTDKLYEQCEALETFLVKTLLTGMRNTIQKSEFLDGGFAGKMYEDMLYDEYAKDFTKNAGFGLAELAYLELTGQRGKRITRYS
ncbi:MAG: rod-binding protein [Spirochaetaceae bacterium]|jgi:flagellar protein FlgJ|nr:rod-binding protein [Spirochaetaceae bacterium]